MPIDDPPTTWRASKATLVELHLAPVHAALVERVTERYGIPVESYDDESWAAFVGGRKGAAPVRHHRPPEQVGEEAFVKAIRRAGFGVKTSTAPPHRQPSWTWAGRRAGRSGVVSA